MMLDWLRALEIHAIFRRILDQAVKISFRIGARVGMNDAHSGPHPSPPPGADPGVAGRRDLAADNQDSLALVAMGGEQVVFRADAETAKAGIHSGLAKSSVFEKRGAVAGCVHHQTTPQLLARRSNADGEI